MGILPLSFLYRPSTPKSDNFCCRMPHPADEQLVPDLSIIIPTCNRSGLLHLAIAHIQSHTRCDYELIVIDGASTDSTDQVLAEAKATLGQKLIVVREEKPEGFTKAANKGFRLATARFVCWLNDD